MGMFDNQRAKGQAVMDGAAASLAACPDPATHYATVVNKGSLNVTIWAGALNNQYAKGYRLAHVFEQDGNTVQVFEHNHP
jgi:putative hemolysin